MKRKSAWLIAWEASTVDRLAAIKGPRILAFIDSRRSRAAIRDMILAIYFASDDLPPGQKLSCALSPERRKALQKEDAASLRCGFNPFVVARQVDNIEIENQPDGSSVVRWSQPVFEQSKKDGFIHHSRSVQRQERIVRWELNRTQPPLQTPTSDPPAAGAPGASGL
jgi:hypothetical protein